MSVETIERCDLCERELKWKSEAFYRTRVKWFVRWNGRDEPKDGATVCQDCWLALGRELRNARESASTQTALPSPSTTGEGSA